MKTDKIKILITVEGGIIQAINSNTKGVQVVVIDYDDQSEEPVFVDSWNPKVSKEPFNETLFKRKLNSREQEAQKQLKKFKF